MNSGRIHVEIPTSAGNVTFSAPFCFQPANTGGTVTLCSYPDGTKIRVIKTIREFTGMALKDAKDASEALPRQFKIGTEVRSTDSAKFAQALRMHAAVVTIEPAGLHPMQEAVNRIVQILQGATRDQNNA